MVAINSVTYKASEFFKPNKSVTDNIQDTSLLCYRINYGHKKFYDTGPR